MTNDRALPALEDGVTLSALGVDNLRALRMEQPVELRRLMLLVGRNGIGKSTFARVFPLLRQSAGGRKREPLLWWERDQVDFGSIEEALRRGADEMTFTFEFTDPSGTPWQAQSVLGQGSAGSRVRRVAIEGAGRRLSLGFDRDGRVETAQGQIARAPFDATSERLWSELQAESGELLALSSDETLTALMNMVHPEDPEISPRTHIVAIWAIKRLHDAAALVDELARRTAYLGPFRAAPERSYRPQGVAVEQLDPRGANLAMFLVALSDHERDDLNGYLRESLDFAIRTELEGGRYVLQVEQGGSAYNLVDVGFGYSQMLPVAVQLWASSRTLSTGRGQPPHAFVVIEQPELHLHPYHQVLMARTFGAFAAADSGPVQLIETHSDHLVGEVGMLVARGQLPPERVSVLCFEPHPEDGATVRTATFDEDGVLQGWPVGLLSP